MGSNSSKPEAVESSNAPVWGRPADVSQKTLERDPPPANFASASSGEGDSLADALPKYLAFRAELFSFAVGESAYDYAERLYRENPKSKEIMALLAETTCMYDTKKVKAQRNHWIDRMDLLQRGIDISRKCIKENPDYGPCYRSYVICASRAADNLYFYRWLEGMGVVENYHAIMRRGKKAMELNPTDPDVPNMLGALNARCVYNWTNPYKIFTLYHRLPSADELKHESVKYHKIAAERDPDSPELMCRLAQAYFLAGDFQNARRCYMKVRDEIPPRELKDDKWQSLAHTQLATAFAKNKWNVPFA
jgi:tetratricopeptide (TPR) repeat protein